MQCPYCEQEMVLGHLFGDEYKMKWMPADKNLILGIWTHDSITLGSGGLIGRAVITAHFCGNCKKLILDQDEN